jgi:hypothetical protein
MGPLEITRRLSDIYIIKMDWVWVTGCVNMAASLAFSAIAHHSKKLDEAAKVSMHRAVGVH